jgi:hypothetical protein
MERSSLKELLNNLTLLRWVKKFSANNLLDDDDTATYNKRFRVTSKEDSVSILDTTNNKLLVTKAEYTGKEYVRFNLEQLNELIECVGKKGELIIPADSDMREMIAKVGNDIVVVCPLPQKDRKEKAK